MVCFRYLLVRLYQGVDIYFDKKFQMKFSRGFAKRPKLTFDLVGFDLRVFRTNSQYLLPVGL